MLILGPLPWSHLNPIKKHRVIGDWKQFIRIHGRDQFFQNCPAEFSALMTLVDAIDFYERPQYEELYKILDGVMSRLCINESDSLDWEVCLRLYLLLIIAFIFSVTIKLSSNVLTLSVILDTLILFRCACVKISTTTC